MSVTPNGYAIKRSILFDNNQGIALGENQKEPEPYATWRFYEKNGKRDYQWGHYKTSLESATKDYEFRISEYQRMYGVLEVGAYKYYSTQRPVDIGTFPKTENGPIRFSNFDRRESLESGSISAWGFLVYDAPLTEQQISNYELHAAPDNPDILEFEAIVTEAACEEIEAAMAAERKKPISERMKEGAEQAAKDNAARTVPEKKTDKGRS